MLQDQLQARAYPSGALEISSLLRQALGLTHKHWARPKMFVRNKRSSFLVTQMNYGNKKFHNIGSSGLYYKTLKTCNVQIL
jgi:hypothetical protein